MSEIIVLIFLILLSGFFSSSEMAYVVANKIKIELRARKNKIAAKYAHYFIEKPHIFFSTILVSNNIVNIAFASLAAVYLFNVFQLSDINILLISTVVLLIFGELIPKYIARELPDRFVLIVSIPLRIIALVIYPVVKVISSISTILTRSANINEENYSYLFGKNDLQDLIIESSTVGKINLEESDIISRVFEMGEQKIYEAMTPRTAIVGVEIHSSIQEVRGVFIESGYSKIPVYEESLDNIKGFVHAYDMFKNPENLSSVIRTINYVPDTKKSLDMLNEFLEKQVSIAVVVDEFGGTAGIVTVEDIIEEVLGEIKDEYDIDENVCKKIDDNTYVISGSVEIDHINEEFDLQLPEGDYETIAGMITSHIGQIPEQGKTHIILEKYKFLIIRSDKRKIELVKLQIMPE
ncbi:MAG: HlyC/CorC family transporter [Melioribacteraceae bacterium]|nr:HlyC/CorC family transporter [Melioribacteraceae bacterium]